MDPERSSVTWRNVLVLLSAEDATLDSRATALRFPMAHEIVDPDAGDRFRDTSAYADRIRAVAGSASDLGEDHQVWREE